MLDRERVLVKLDEMRGYIDELRQVAPTSLAEYQRSIEKKRSCERLLQIAVDCVIDICQLFVTGLRLGLPGGEDDLFHKLAANGIFSSATVTALRRMKGCRNILVHEYGRVSDEIVFTTVRDRLGDFDEFATSAKKALASHSDPR